MTPANAKPILVVGSINMDLVSSAARIPLAGETILGSSFATHPGGKGANQAVAIARLGYPVQMLGCLGSDSIGESLHAHLQEAGVELAGVIRVSGSSGTAAITVAADGQNCIVVTAGANTAVTPACLDAHLRLIQQSVMVLTQLEIPLESVQHLAALCKQEGVPLMLDPAPAQALPVELLEQIAWFTPNETEAAFFAQELPDAKPEQTAAALLAQGPAGVVLKQGERGAYVATKDFTQQLPAAKVSAMDTTAAGDCFNGAFAVALALGQPLEQAVRFAIAAASISVTRMGAQSSMPTRAEVEQQLAIR